MKIDKHFNYLNYLLEFEKKNENLSDKRIIKLYLYIAFIYLKRNNQEQASQYFLKAIDYDPEIPLLLVIFVYYIITTA